MIGAILLAAAAIAALLALHPFTTYPVTLWLARQAGSARRRRTGADRSDETTPPPTLALCFCAYREEPVIGEKIANLIALQKATPGLSVYAYVDGADDDGDRTGERLAAFADRFTVVQPGRRTGKSVGMNALVARTAADIVVFTDANVMLEVEALNRLARHFADPSVGCVCGHLRYVTEADSVTGEVGSLYWRLEEKIKQWESDTGSVIGADGSIFAIRRSLHRPPPPDIIDDMYVSLSILCDGYRVVRAPDVYATERSVPHAGEEFRRKVRIACQAFNVHRLLWSRLRRLAPWTFYKYVSHKLLRWLSVYSLAAAVLLATAGLVALGTLWAVAILWAVGAAAIVLGAMGVPGLSHVVSILTALLGAGLGIAQSLRGERYQTWTPAATIRRAADPEP